MGLVERLAPGPVARLVHARSARASGPLVELLAGSRPDVEAAEALGPRGDWLQRAEGGTLVVHEVARLGPLAQLALLRALDAPEGEEGTGDVRIVATTSIDLEGEVRSGRFREELLYRLNVLSLPVPSLSERTEHVPRERPGNVGAAENFDSRIDRAGGKLGGQPAGKKVFQRQ